MATTNKRVTAKSGARRARKSVIPTLPKSKVAAFTAALRAITGIDRPVLVGVLVSGATLPVLSGDAAVSGKNASLADLPAYPAGRVNTARKRESVSAIVYDAAADTTRRSTGDAASYRETTRHYIGKVAAAYREATGGDYPTDRIMVVAGDDDDPRPRLLIKSE